MDLLQQYLDAERLCLCWDVAKTFRAAARGDERMEAFCRRNLSRVRQVHLHDVLDDRSHLAVGTGRIDFMKYLPELSEADVAEFCHEVRPRERAAASLANLRETIESETARKARA